MYRKVKILLFFITLLLFPDFLFAAAVTVDPKQTYQTIEGFGASVAWYEISLAAHPNREDLYHYAFRNLGLSILRIRNAYRYKKEESFNPYISEIVKNMYEYSDRSPKILMSSWSPPLELKSNNAYKGGTLKKDKNGKFMYDAFGKYWVDSLKAYKEAGIVPDYISIQNEPTWGQWDSCLFKETETTDTAGYDKALEAVYKALKPLKSPPKILAPEEHGIGYNAFQNFAERFNKDLIYGYAYHLYHGGDGGSSNPDSFNRNFERIAKNYSEKPIFQTEYDVGDWFNTAWIMHNALVHGNVSAYLYWALVWQGDKALIQLEDLGRPSEWTTSEGYILTPYYYAFRQYSKFISPGWKRISAESDTESLKISAFISPGKDKLTIVALNTSDKDCKVSIDEKDFRALNGGIFRTSENERGKYVGLYNEDAVLDFPSRSITTLALDIKLY